MVLRLLALFAVAFVLMFGTASASDVRPETCAYGAISAMGPVDALGNGAAIPDVACIEP
jgi:hypothetical protein